MIQLQRFRFNKFYQISFKNDIYRAKNQNHYEFNSKVACNRKWKPKVSFKRLKK